MDKSVVESMKRQLETQRVEQSRRSAALAETRSQLQRQQEEFDEAAVTIAALEQWIQSMGGDQE